MSFKVSLIMPDAHIPNHDRKAVDVMFSIAKDLPRLDEIVILGDLADFYGVSLHDVLPDCFGIKQRLKDEVYFVNKFLDVMQTFNKPIKWLEGNHLVRLKKYLVKKAPALFDLIDNETLFKLDERDLIEFYPFRRNQLARVLDTNLFARHQPYNQGVNCANGTIQKKNISLIFGHTHRVQTVIKKRGDKSFISAYSCGCLIDFESPVFSYADTDDWAHAFGVVYQFSNDPEDYIVNIIEIKNGKAIYNGNLYEGEDKDIWDGLREVK